MQRLLFTPIAQETLHFLGQYVEYLFRTNRALERGTGFRHGCLESFREW